MKTEKQEFVYRPKKFFDKDIAIEVQNIESHRNGTSGEGFFVLTFTDEKMDGRFVGIVFRNLLQEDRDGYYTLGLIHKSMFDEGWSNPQVAVLEIDLLSKGIIGSDNKWRGDYYLPILVKAIVDAEKKLKKFHKGLAYDEEQTMFISSKKEA